MYEKPDKADLLHLHENVLVRWELAILSEELLLLGIEFLENAMHRSASSRVGRECDIR